MPRRLAFDGRRFLADVERIVAQRQMTRCSMARHIGVHDATLSRMKTRGRNPDVPGMLAIAIWAGLDPRQYFIDRELEELAA